VEIMSQSVTWVSYSGDARIWLALGLLAASGGAVLAGLLLPLPIRFTRPGPTGQAVMIAAWGASLAAFLVCSAIYIRQLTLASHAAGLTVKVPRPPVLPVTLTAAVIVFVIIARSSPDPRTKLASAAVGTMAAPMIFELPFDPLVVPRVRWLFLPDPAMYKILLYTPLLLVEITTLLLLRISPMVRLTRATFLSFALMLGVWAAWALAGFGYPSAPVPIVLNIASKILAFVTGLTLFLPVDPRLRGRSGSVVSMPS
jgi:hypothetical protein